MNGAHPPAVQQIDKYLHGRTLAVSRKHFQHHRGGLGVDLIILLFVNIVAHWDSAAVVFAFQRIVGQTPDITSEKQSRKKMQKVVK